MRPYKLTQYILFSIILFSSSSWAQNIGSTMSFDSSNNNPPKCESAASDTDGDGWGWENMTSCTVEKIDLFIYPTCKSPSSDPDGDGWGWENSKSCKVEKKSLQNTEIDNQNSNSLEQDFLNANILDIKGEGSSEITIEFELLEKGPAFIEYGFSEKELSFKGPIEVKSYELHRQKLKNIARNKKYYFVINSNGLRTKLSSFNNLSAQQNPIENSNPSIEHASTTITKQQSSTTLPSTRLTSSSSGSLSFKEIKKNGLSNGCYPNEDHYLAEYLFQNPDTCFWKIDKNNQRIHTLPIPKVPGYAVQLPKPSGGDDTKAIEAVINANSGGAVVGNGIYKINDLKINVPIDIFHMKMEPAGAVKDFVTISSPDVSIFYSPIDAKNSDSVTSGFKVLNGAHRFTLVKSGLSNVYHTRKESMAGVIIRAASDFHIACNKFENLINNTSDKSKTARANSIWLNGGKTGKTAGGYIINNYSKNHQSNGRLNDSEFFTIQSYASTDPSKPVKIFGNYTVDPGKRFTKHQESDALVLSNHYEWTTKSGPLGNRTLLSHVEIQFSNNVIARNNRVKVAAGSRFDYILNSDMHLGKNQQNNIHYDCNDIEIKDKISPTSGNIPHIIVFRASLKDKNSTNWAATNSSANYNRIHGKGSVKYHYLFGSGYHDDGRSVDHIGNIFEIPATIRQYK